MHNPNHLVYFTNPKTFTSLHSVKFMKINCNPTFNFNFIINNAIGIKDSKVACACPRLVCCDYNYCFLLITITKPF
jgi:hypothetical protein